MATVINLPKDTRWSNAGRAIGQTMQQVQERRKQKEEEERRQQAYEEGLQSAKEAISSPDFNAGEVYQDLGSKFQAAGREDDLDDVMNFIMESRAEATRRRTRESYVNNLPPSSPLRQRTEGNQDIDPDTIDTLSRSEDRFRDDLQQTGERQLTVYNQQGGERKVFVPEDVPSGEIDQFVRKEHGEEWSTTKPGEGDVGGGAAGAKDIRDVEGVLVNRGVQPQEATPQQRAGARNIVNNYDESHGYLAQTYGKDIVQDPLGSITVTSWRGEDARVKYNLALQSMDDHLYEGLSPGDAVARAETEAEREYKTGSWIPEEVKREGIEGVQQFLEERSINDPDLVGYMEAEQTLEGVQRNPSAYSKQQAREAHKRVLEVRNPTASAEEIKKHLDGIYGEE